MAFREEKLKKQIMEHAAKFIELDANRNALITVTNCDISPKQNHATVYVTILPEKQEEEIIKDLEAKAGEMRKYIFDHLRIRAVPALKIVIDYGEKNRQRVEELSTQNAI